MQAILVIVILVLTLFWPLLAFHNPQGGISAAGWITEAVWIAVIIMAIAALVRSGNRKQAEQKRKRAEEAVTNGTALPAGYGALRVHDVIDPSLPRDQRTPHSLLADHLVKSSTLDDSSKVILARAQLAIKDVLTSRVYADDQLERDAAEPTLRSHEWAIAVALREITSLRKEQASVHKGDDPGPLTRSVMDAQGKAFAQKLEKILSIVNVMETYAGHVKAADNARKDWNAAAELSKLNEKFTDLVAGTAADEVHLREVEDMTEEAKIFQESLTQANLAARSLFLPDTAAESV